MSANPTPPAGPMEQKPCQHRALRSYDVPVCKDCGAVDWNALPDAALARRPLSAPDATAPLLTTSNDGKAGVVASGVTHVVYPAPDATGGDALSAFDALRRAGTLLSNCAYNLAQHDGQPLTGDERRSLRESYEAWDRCMNSIKGIRAALAGPPLPVAREENDDEVVDFAELTSQAYTRGYEDAKADAIELAKSAPHPVAREGNRPLPEAMRRLCDGLEQSGATLVFDAESAPHPAAGKREEDSKLPEGANRGLAALWATRTDARDDFFLAISTVADRLDVEANGPNRPGHRRDLSRTTVTMNDVLKCLALCEANDAATFDISQDEKSAALRSPHALADTGDNTNG